jgi:hypothetical protein
LAARTSASVPASSWAGTRPIRAPARPRLYSPPSMADSPLLPDKEQEDEATNDREWNVQVAGRVVLGLAVLAALAGLFGAGPLSWSSEAAGDGSIEVEYKRFARSGGPADLSLSVPVSGANREARVWLDAGYLESLDIEQITPEP